MSKAGASTRVDLKFKCRSSDEFELKKKPNVQHMPDLVAPVITVCYPTYEYAKAYHPIKYWHASYHIASSSHYSSSQFITRFEYFALFNASLVQ